MKFPPVILVACIIFASAFLPENFLNARDIYVLPEGSGTKDGSGWENAQSGSGAGLQSAWNAAAPGDVIRIGSGDYGFATLVAERGGEEGRPIRLTGEDRGSGLPVFTGGFDKEKLALARKGGYFFTANQGVSNFEISGLHLRSFLSGIYLLAGNSNIQIADLEIEGCREGIRSEGGATNESPDGGTHHVTISDCKFIHFTKGAIRMQSGNSDWKIERCLADAGGKEWAVEPFHMAFHVIGKNSTKHSNKVLKAELKTPGSTLEPGSDHHIEYLDCVAVNSYSELTKSPKIYEKSGLPVPSAEESYWNGDGFNAERGCHDIRYVRCVSMHHTDGGWDDKSDAPQLIDCVALDNKENFRIWSPNGSAKMINCLSGFACKRGGTGKATGIWCAGSLEGEHCSVIDSGDIQVDFTKSENPDATISFKNSIFYTSKQSEAKLGGGEEIKLIESIVCANGDAKTDPVISAKKGVNWENGTKAFDSAKYGPGQGFHSSLWNK